MIPYGRQHITQADIDAVIDVLQSDWLTQGPSVSEFEQSFAQYCFVKHALAVNSATSALHVACLALGLGEGDWLWTSPNTFVASANCGRYCGANVDFVDIDPHTYNMCPQALEQKLIEAEKQQKLPKIVIPVHFAGQSCDMRMIKSLSDKYGFFIIEDAAHAVGAKYLDKPVGNCAFSDITVFSLHPVKIITTAEGGVAFTNNDELAEKMALYRSHGVARKPEFAEIHGPWYYEQSCLGLNYRITDVQCALGSSQLTRLDDYVAKRHELAKVYDEAFADCDGLITPFQNNDAYSSYHLYPAQFTNVSRKEAFTELREKGVGVNVHYIPVHTQKYYQDLGFSEGYCPNAEKYYSQTISLPLFPQLTQDQQQYVIESVKDLL